MVNASLQAPAIAPLTEMQYLKSDSAWVGHRAIKICQAQPRFWI